MTMNNLFSHPSSVQRQDIIQQTFTKPMEVVEEDTATTSSSASPLFYDPKIHPSSSGLASRGSADSMSSWASTSTTETTESDSVTSLTRRSIFSDYWKTKTPPVILDEDEEDNEDEDEDHPRSPPLQHYPSRKESSQSPISTPTLQQQQQQEQEQDLNKNTKKVIAASPPRRSIFGTRAKSNSYGSVYNGHDNNIDLNNFFSNHRHMKVLSSSVDSPPSFTALKVQRRSRSYSCSDDTSVEARSPLRKGGALPSCLKRRRNIYGDRNSTSTTTSSIATSNTDDAIRLAEAPERRPSVTFDSQIEIVAFEPTSSLDVAPTCMDGSWADLFER